MAQIFEQDQDIRLVRLARVIFGKVKAGQSLSQSMEDLPDHFSPFQVSMVRVGETSGQMSQMLLVLDQEEVSFVKSSRQVWQSMLSPLITLVIAFAAMFILLPLFVFGSYLQLMKDLQVPEDQGPLLALMRFTQTPWWWAGLAALLVAMVLVFALRKEREKFLRSFFRALSHSNWLGRYFQPFRDADSTSSYAAAFLENAVLSGKWSMTAGKAWRCHVGSRFAATLGRLWGVNVGLLKSVELAIEVSGSALLAVKRKEILNRLKEGASLANALISAQVFSEKEMLVSMIAVGEESGKVPQLCQLVSEYYRMDLESRLRSAAAALSPMVYLLLGVLVGGLIIMMLTPMSKLIESL